MSTKDFTGHKHNTMRFNVILANSTPMFDDGEMNKDEMASEICQAIIAIVNRHANWRVDNTEKHESQVDGKFDVSKWLHHETILYDFS